MIGIPYIKSLFKAILDQSKVMQGRFYICPNWGTELNKINIAEIVEYAKPKDVKEVKYPVVVMMPIKSTGNFQFSGMESVGNAYHTKEITMLFLATAYTTGQNQVINPLPNNLPQHTIPDTWHDMERCANNFLQVLRGVVMNSGIQGTLYISEDRKQEIYEIVEKANDKATGVLLKFDLRVNGGCDIEDYPIDYLSAIVVPDVEDTHPIHSL